MRGRVREGVIYFMFHENRLRGLGAVDGLKSPSPIDLAHRLYNSLCTRRDKYFTSPVHNELSTHAPLSTVCLV